MLVVALVVAAAGTQVPAARAADVAEVVRPAPRTARLSAAQMFALADYAQTHGDERVATQIYLTLAADPDRNVSAEARFRRAKQLIAGRHTADAVVLLRSIIDDRPDATGVRIRLAGLLHELGEDESAMRQLRAAQAAGLPPAVARLVDRYSEALRAQRPFGASLEIALAPDSNINRATRSDTLGTIFGDFDIEKDSKAKSGTGMSVQGQVFRRMAVGDQSLLVRLTGTADLYRQTEFNDIAVDLAAGPELRLGRNRLNLELGATQRWFGQKPFMRSARLGATWTRPLGSRMQLRLTGSAALVDNQFNDLQDGKSYSGEVEVERALSTTTGVGLSLSANRQALNDPGYSTTGLRAGLLGWHDIARMTFTAAIEYGELHADERLQLFPEKRSDRYSRLSLGATFRQLQFRGFAPLVRFSIERNRSTIGFYDYSRTRTEMGVVRAF